MEVVKLELEDSVDQMEEDDRYFSCAESELKDYQLIKKEKDGNLDLNKNAVFLLENHSSLVEDNTEDSRSQIERPNEILRIKDYAEDIDHGKKKANEDVTWKNNDCKISNSKLHTINVQLKGEKLKCEFCAFDTENTIELKAHMKSVHRQFEFKCHICNYSNPLEFCLNRHIALEHSEKGEFNCSLCDYSTLGKFKLRDHVNAVHLKLKNYKCDQCNYGAYRKNHLQLHIDSVHSALKKFKCDFCGYGTNRKIHFDTHMLSVHTQTKEFNCQYCDYSTNLKFRLNYHVRSAHSTTKRFKCDSCEYSSTRKYRLKVHVDCMH